MNSADKYREALQAFRQGMEPWIRDQIAIDGDDVQVMEILQELVDGIADKTLPFTAEVKSRSDFSSFEVPQGWDQAAYFVFRWTYKNEQQKRLLEDLVIKEIGPHHDATIEWDGINSLTIIWRMSR